MKNEKLHPLLREIIKASKEGKNEISLDVIIKSLMNDDDETLEYVLDKLAENKRFGKEETK